MFHSVVKLFNWGIR